MSNESFSSSGHRLGGVWALLASPDPHALRIWLRSLGFTEGPIVAGRKGTVGHSFMYWPEGGAVVIGSVGHRGDDDDRPHVPAGRSVFLVVTERAGDVLARSRAVGGELVPGLESKLPESTLFAVRDPDGNIWAFGPPQA